jgi:hypothetical protein
MLPSGSEAAVMAPELGKQPLFFFRMQSQSLIAAGFSHQVGRQGLTTLRLAALLHEMTSHCPEGAEKMIPDFSTVCALRSNSSSRKNGSIEDRW